MFQKKLMLRNILSMNFQVSTFINFRVKIKNQINFKENWFLVKIRFSMIFVCPSQLFLNVGT